MKNGGKRPGAGRKSKAEELGLAALLENSFTLKDREAVIVNLSRIAKGSDDKAAVSASSLLLAYTYGKPTEKHEHGGEGGGPIVLKVVYAQPRVNNNPS